MERTLSIVATTGWSLTRNSYYGATLFIRVLELCVRI